MMPLADVDEVGVHIGLPAGVAVDEADARFFEVLKSCVRAARARSLNLLLRSPKGVIVVRSPFVSPLSRRAVSYRELTRARAILGRGGPCAAGGCRGSRPKESGELKVMMPLAADDDDDDDGASDE